MEAIRKHKFTPSFFWFSLLCHLLFLFFVLYFPNRDTSKKYDKKLEKNNEKTYYYYMPAYRAKSSPIEKNKMASLKKLDKAFDLSQFQQKKFSPSVQNTRALKMIGEKLLDDPLRKLLGEAITANLSYPEMARTLHLRGVVSIGFTLYPSGELGSIHIVKSSRQRILDLAALNAVTAASPVSSVDIYLKQAKYLVVNVVF